jgi:hypothetical protein
MLEFFVPYDLLEIVYLLRRLEMALFYIRTANQCGLALTFVTHSLGIGKTQAPAADAKHVERQALQDLPAQAINQNLDRARERDRNQAWEQLLSGNVMFNQETNALQMDSR